MIDDKVILQEIVKQNPKLQTNVNAALQANHTATDIIDEIVKQNPKIATSVNKARGTDQTTETKPKSFLRKVADFFTSSEQTLGKAFGTAASVVSPEVNKNRNYVLNMAKEQSDRFLNMAKTTSDPQKKKNYLEAAKNAADISGVDIFNNTEYQKTAKQIYGAALGTVADIASFGTYGEAAKAAETGSLLTKSAQKASLAEKGLAKTSGQAFKEGAIQAGKEGAVLGGAYGASQAMQENKNVGEIAKDTVVGSVIGGLFGAVTGGLFNKGNNEETANKLKQKAIEQYKRGLQATKQKQKELADKIVPSLLESGTWGSMRSLMKKADEGIELSMQDYKKLGELQGIISSDGLLSDIDSKAKAMLRPDGTPFSEKKISYNKLMELKTDILSLRQKSWVAGQDIATQTVNQEDLRKLAQQYGATLYESRKALKTISDSKTLSVIKDVDGAIRDLLNTKNPEYAKINKVNTLNSRLKDVLIETAKRKAPQNWIGLIDSVWGAGGAIAGAISGHGDIKTSVILAGAGVSLHKIMTSTWWNTMRAVQKYQLANKIVSMSASMRAQTLSYISRQGIKAVEELLNQ